MHKRLLKHGQSAISLSFSHQIVGIMMEVIIAISLQHQFHSPPMYAQSLEKFSNTLMFSIFSLDLGVFIHLSTPDLPALLIGIVWFLPHSINIFQRQLVEVGQIGKRLHQAILVSGRDIQLDQVLLEHGRTGRLLVLPLVYLLIEVLTQERRLRDQQNLLQCLHNRLHLSPVLLKQDQSLGHQAHPDQSCTHPLVAQVARA